MTWEQQRTLQVMLSEVTHSHANQKKCGRLETKWVFFCVTRKRSRFDFVEYRHVDCVPKETKSKQIKTSPA